MLKVMFAGASGTGKTTLCQKLSSQDKPFISGSVSDLLPDTEKMSHKEMLSREPSYLFSEDYQILNLRNKLFSQNENFITDRSYIDSAAYFIYKQADKVPQCEVEQFVNLCLMCLSQQCTHLVFIPFTPIMFKEWVTEDNGKRITSKYFQMQISSIMRMVLDIAGYKPVRVCRDIPQGIVKINRLTYGWEEGYIETLYGTTKVLIIYEPGLDNRQLIIQRWLKKN